MNTIEKHFPKESDKQENKFFPEYDIDFNNKTIKWSGFYTGADTLAQNQIAEIGKILLGETIVNDGIIDIEKLNEFSEQYIEPFTIDFTFKKPRSVILHSATSTTGGLEGDLSEIENAGHAYDCATYLETRATSLADRGDLVVGRTSPWTDATDFLNFSRNNIQYINIGKLNYYYLTHSLLVLAFHYDKQSTNSEIHPLIEWVKEHPDSLFRLYTLDVEMQIFLCWLNIKCRIGSKLKIDSNSAEISTNWNQKAPLFPYVKTIENIRLNKESSDWYTTEKPYSSIYQQLNISLPTLPGYSIDNSDSNNPNHFFSQLKLAAELLKKRYDIRYICLKPSNAGDGARISTRIDANDEKHLLELAETAYLYKDDYIVEPHFYYLKLNLSFAKLNIAPSAHIRYGKTLETITLQIMDGKVWVGNVLIAKNHISSVNITTEEYDKIIQSVEMLRQSMSGKLVTAGIDFCIGYISENTSDRVLALQDPNLSSHGAEYLRSYCDKHKKAIEQGYTAATRVIQPTSEQNLITLSHQLSQYYCQHDKRVEVIASVPGRWAMIACLEKTPIAAIEELHHCEKWLQRFSEQEGGGI